MSRLTEKFKSQDVKKYIGYVFDIILGCAASYALLKIGQHIHNVLALPTPSPVSQISLLMMLAIVQGIYLGEAFTEKASTAIFLASFFLSFFLELYILNAVSGPLSSLFLLSFVIAGLIWRGIIRTDENVGKLFKVIRDVLFMMLGSYSLGNYGLVIIQISLIGKLYASGLASSIIVFAIFLLGYVVMSYRHKLRAFYERLRIGAS